MIPERRLCLNGNAAIYFIFFTESTSETFIETQSLNNDSTHATKRDVFERRHFR